MLFNILVTGGLYSTQSGYSALQFCRAVVKAGHHVKQVFFYRDGVSQGSALSVPLSDEFDAVSEWVTFAEQYDTPLVVCVSAAERRGLLNPEQATEHDKVCANLHPRFVVEGLGGLHDASLTADRTVMFK